MECFLQSAQIGKSIEKYLIWKTGTILEQITIKLLWPGITTLKITGIILKINIQIAFTECGNIFFSHLQVIQIKKAESAMAAGPVIKEECREVTGQSGNILVIR